MFKLNLFAICVRWVKPFYTTVEDRTYYGITRGVRVSGRRGGRRPVLCPEHISKTILAMVMKFYCWIDLIKGSAVHMNLNSCLLFFFFSYCPLFIFILDFCPVHISKTILAMVMKFYCWIDLMKGSAVHMNHNSCLLFFFFFLVIALCLFSYLTFVRCISPKLY